jgi:hypothetical protein
MEFRHKDAGDQQFKTLCALARALLGVAPPDPCFLVATLRFARVGQPLAVATGVWGRAPRTLARAIHRLTRRRRETR